MRRAIIIVDHGSRRQQANEMLTELADLVGSLGGERVYAAHMELAEPTVGQAFDAAVADGAQFIFVFPYFLSPGRHSREDVPGLCAEAGRRHPEVRWHCSGPIGLDRIVAELILQRMARCEAQGFQCADCPDDEVCHRTIGD
jgi:sirohydrochlorin ferrochelatase